MSYTRVPVYVPVYMWSGNRGFYGYRLVERWSCPTCGIIKEISGTAIKPCCPECGSAVTEARSEA